MDPPDDSPGGGLSIKPPLNLSTNIVTNPSVGDPSQNKNKNSSSNGSTSRSFASVTKYVEKECSTEELFSKEGLIYRGYEIRGNIPLGLRSHIEMNYKSVVLCVPYKYKTKLGNDFKTVLKVGFSKEAPSYVKDWTACNELKINLGGREVVLRAIHSELLDKNGTFVPRVAKMLVLKDVNPELVQNPDILKEVLEGYVKFEDNFKIKCIKEGPNMMFKGKVIIPIKSYLKKVDRVINFPALYYDADSEKTIRDPDGLTVPVTVAAIGFDLKPSEITSTDPPKAKKPAFKCWNCGNKNHKSINCPEPPKTKNFRCRVCDGYNVGCSRETCLNRGSVMSGVLISSKQQASILSEHLKKQKEQKEARKEANRKESQKKKKVKTNPTATATIADSIEGQLNNAFSRGVNTKRRSNNKGSRFSIISEGKSLPESRSRTQKTRDSMRDRNELSDDEENVEQSSVLDRDNNYNRNEHGQAWQPSGGSIGGSVSNEDDDF